MRHYWRCMLHFVHKSKDLTFTQEVEISPFLRHLKPQDRVYHWHLADNRRERAETEPFTFRSIIIEHIGSAPSGEIEKVPPPARLLDPLALPLLRHFFRRASRELSLSPNLAEQCMIALLRSFALPFVLSRSPSARSLVGAHVKH